MNLKFSAEVKQIFIDTFNTSSKEVPSINIHKVLTEKLHTLGHLPPNVELNAEAVRLAFEKMGLNYRNRPKNNQVMGISFEDSDEFEDVKDVKDEAALISLHDTLEEVTEETVEETLFEA